jgi:hypothetical protein
VAPCSLAECFRQCTFERLASQWGHSPFFGIMLIRSQGFPVVPRSTFLRREWMAPFCSSCVETRFAWMSFMPVNPSPQCLKPVRVFETPRPVSHKQHYVQDLKSSGSCVESCGLNRDQKGDIILPVLFSTSSNPSGEHLITIAI